MQLRVDTLLDEIQVTIVPVMYIDRAAAAIERAETELMKYSPQLGSADVVEQNLKIAEAWLELARERRLDTLG